MTYLGKIQNGVVGFEGEMPPEGTAVQVQPLPSTNPSGTSPVTESKTVWEELLELQGQVPTLPQDAARNHDHYLYGTPKR
ncbi:MAG TPA: hypothetical protein VFC46_07545 [Humisphaera sp.]|nr:hypothetical protein [Humisphaera sp.]